MNSAAQSLYHETIRMAARQASTGLRARLSQLTEPHILFPALTILIPGAIWSATFKAFDSS